ncbi:similar to polyamine oxidase [Plenodomus lingam JN3]|uniref:Amine oxidase n=1 Tax=Leptosphaeria maculans (strain JN3 / isolate v23.1.3 / race Av1-4-5-6-7-8) TaxID=985895 RepID=E4ZJK7_LEPMJ|nr:similar to polyamine oxidase [Plenodomus lingam JN3]CBX91292.1 similar to polyamine oxidase [Plenodomus lingam JN3]
MALSRFIFLAVSLLPLSTLAAPALSVSHDNNSTCQRTKVAIIGAGVAGITAAQALSNQSVTDFLILEYNNGIGGRMRNTKFGADANGNPYTIELGANWISGLGETLNGPENPVWTFSKQVNLSAPNSDDSSIATYNETGAVDFTNIIEEYEEYWAVFEKNAGRILKENLQDRSFRAGLWQSGWRTKGDAARKAVDFWMWDWETAQTPEESSFVYGIVGHNLTYYGFSELSNFCTDQRGFNEWLRGQARKFLKPNDPRLLLNTIVTNVTYSDDGVTILNEDGSCIEADYAISTVSLGVLQNDAITFEPALPEWKQDAIATFSMGTYTKMFFQFNETFWPTDKQFFLYADPTTRGYYTIWQSLSTDGFLPGSNILFATLVDEQSARVEAQNNETTKAEAMAVLRNMFPDINVPEPTAFYYPRWGQVPWSYGSYSNWPAGTTLEMHQNLRANVDRLYFAGEAQSAEYFGFLHGAWFEGQEVGQRIAGQISKQCVNVEGGCGNYINYEVLHGTTGFEEVNALNGLGADPFFVADSGSEYR